MRSSHCRVWAAFFTAVSLFATVVAGGCVGNGDRSVADYAACESDPECRLGSNCLTVPDALGLTQGPMCTRACVADTDCTGGGSCLGARTAGQGICYAQCPSTRKCNAGFTCQDTESGGVQLSLCVPQ